MSYNEPNWTYRDLLNCAKAEIDNHLTHSTDPSHRQQAVAKAWGVIGLWLRLTDEARDPEDLAMLIARIDSSSSTP